VRVTERVHVAFLTPNGVRMAGGGEGPVLDCRGDGGKGRRREVAWAASDGDVIQMPAGASFAFLEEVAERGVAEGIVAEQRRGADETVFGTSGGTLKANRAWISRRGRRSTTSEK